jgi:hypothetical protein
MGKLKRRALGPNTPWERAVVALTTDLGTKNVPAKRYGQIAVHGRAGDKDRMWVVTHIPTGLAITGVNTEPDALKIGEVLWGRCCLAFREASVEGILKKLPGWVRNWVLACRETGVFQDPAPYEEGKSPSSSSVEQPSSV